MLKLSKVTRPWGLVLAAALLLAPGVVLVLRPLPAAVAQSASGESSNASEAGEGGRPAALEMPAAERAAQGVATTEAGPRSLTKSISAPGQVSLDAYRSSQVTPRISAQIVARHARLGNVVKAGQSLVTLSSVAMAEAQGALIEADREWRRVKALGRSVVSEQRYIAAEVARQRSYATVRAYGLTAAQTDRLLEGGDATLATGEFELLSPQAGTIIRDAFVVGEVVEPGRLLFEITGESVLWVEAQLPPEDAADVRVGAPARISAEGRSLPGEVVQLHHAVDRATRTRGVRIEVDNSNDALHAGDYVEVSLETGATSAPVAVPSTAILLMDGSPAVFKVEGEKVLAQAVETGARGAGWTEIKAGLAAGTEVVSQGTFLIKSLLLKSQIGDAD